MDSDLSLESGVLQLCKEAAVFVSIGMIDDQSL